MTWREALECYCHIQINRDNMIVKFLSIFFYVSHDFVLPSRAELGRRIFEVFDDEVADDD